MRNQHIDNLRGFGTLLIILIHVLALYLGEYSTRLLWDLAHADVPVFVFCSGYLYFASQKDEHPLAHIVRRIKRLLVPYYIYVLAFYTVSFFVNRAVVTPNHIISSLLIIGGIDISWLVQLFIYNAIILSVMRYWLNRHAKIFDLFGIVAVLSTVVLLFWRPALDYRWYMWLPWSSVLYYSYYFLQKHTHRLFFATATGLGLIGFLTTLLVKLWLRQDLTFYTNKYPPNLFYLLYGLLAVNIVYFLSLKGVFSYQWISRILHFSSRYSYPLFFIHYLLLTLITDLFWQRYFHWTVLYVLIVALSFGITKILNHIHALAVNRVSTNSV